MTTDLQQARGHNKEKTMTTEQQVELLKEIAEDVRGEVYEGYSGRGMFGGKCWGISCDDELAVVEAAKELGLPRPKIDSLGKGFICYWPSLDYVTEATP